MWGDLDRRGSVDEDDALRIPRPPRTDARESQPVWDTRSPGGGWPGSRDRLALAVGAALMVAAILAAVTGKVLASGPPDLLPESSPTADNSETPTQASSPEPVDPRSLFLDLPAPEVSAIRSPETAAAREAARPARRAAAKEVLGARSRGEGPSQDARPRSPGLTPAVSEAEEVAEDSPPVRSVEPGSGEASDLLDDPDCRFSEVARRDLRAGIVDEYLISTLQAVCREHSIYVNVFKTGHTFGAGLEEGPTIPVGYGNAGGYPNTHYFGRAADIWEVDGKSIEGNGSDPDVVSVGRILAGLPSRNKPDVVIGPAAWNRELGYGPAQGWVLDQDQVSLHDDHLHIGYWHGDGTPPPQLFLSTNDRHEVPASANGGVRRSASDSDRTSRRAPKLKETIEPAKSPASNPRSPRGAGEKKDREKLASQKTVVRRLQPPGAQGADPTEPAQEKTEQKTSKEQRSAPDTQRPESGSTTRSEEQTTNTSVQYETQVEEMLYAEGEVAEDAAD